MSNWYDDPETVNRQDYSLSISYACESVDPIPPQILNLHIIGENTQPPTFTTTGEYAGTISKGMTPWVALDCLPIVLNTNFHMVVVDTDFIDPDNDEGSSNEVTCQVDPDDFFDCQACGSPGEYEIHLVLKKSLTTINKETYNLTVVAQVRPERYQLSMYSYPLNSGPRISCSSK